MAELQHTTVLLQEAVSAWLALDAQHASDSTPLQILRPRRFIDATYGRGGHSQLALQQLSESDQLLVFDKDPQAIAHAKALGDKRVDVVHGGFAGMADLPAQSADGVLMDLGVSSPQLDDASRGFSFRFDAPLDMRMDTTRGQTVAEWLQTASVPAIAQVLRDYSEERFALAIAKAIDARRLSGQPVATTAELSELVGRTVKTREAGQNPATRSFQAFRIHINAELQELQQALAACLGLLKPMGRLVVISFHSLEDRIVKQFMVTHSRSSYDRRVPHAPAKLPVLDVLARIKPSAAEVAANPRSRSAVMRVASRTHAALGALA